MYNENSAKTKSLELSLKHVNDVLSFIVLALAIYILAAPLFPSVSYVLKSDPPLIEASESEEVDIAPDRNVLLMPSIKLEEEIYQGGPEVLNEGLWHMPSAKTPNTNNNFVISGHRFTYAGPDVLYNLNNVKKGDRAVIYWDQKKYEYKVKDILVVRPDEIWVQEPTDYRLLTIYTCTPLTTATHRLVIQAVPEEVY